MVYLTQIFIERVIIMQGEKLKELRELTGLSQKDFAVKINLSQTHMASMENNKRKITPRVVQDIIRTFRVNEEWLENNNPPIFFDAHTKEEDDVQQLISKYILLSDKDKALVLNIVESLMEKLKK